MVILAVWRWNINNSEKRAQYYVSTLRASIPEPQNAALEERRDNTMSVLSVDGTDFVGIIELPRYESTLPVCADWGKTTKYPCRFSGSIYDGTMQIGATTQKGQYDFYRELSVGDAVIYTDVEGNRYTFAITSLRYGKHADQTALQHEEAPLTLFIKNIYSFEYLIVFCDVLY
jgi:sortase A